MSRHTWTFCFVVVLVPAVAAAQGVAASPAAPSVAPPASTTICDLLTQEVIGKLGPDVSVTACEAEDIPGEWTSVRSDANARIGQPSTFILVGAGKSARVRATVQAEGPHARVTDAVTRGRVLTTDMFREADGPLTGARFARLPQAALLTGARVTRPLDADALVQDLDVSLAPLVKAGETVLAVVRIGGVEVSATMTAVDAGSMGDEIRIAHKDRKRVLQGRIVAPGRVEVVYAR
jgi:flagella basal body P-ring formation protein FlgA